MKQMNKNWLVGLSVCILIAFISKSIAIKIPNMNAASLAIILGIIIANLVITGDKYDIGVKFAEGTLLSWSIVLLGGTLNIKEIYSIGINGALFIVLQMTFTILIAIFIGKKFGFSKKFNLLMAAGNAVCGSSAIGATSKAIGADDDDKVISITIVNLIGTILMFILPYIAGVIFQGDIKNTSAFIGGILQSIGQVVASAAFIGEEVVKFSTIFKIMRVILLVVIVIIFSRLCEEKCEEKTKCNKFIMVPWFIIGFFIMSLAHTMDILPNSISALCKNISNNFELIALAGIGMRVKFKTIIRQGASALFMGGLIGIAQVVSAIIIILVMF